MLFYYDAVRLNSIYVSGLDKLSVTHLDGLASFVDPHTIRIAGANKEDDTIIRGEACFIIHIDIMTFVIMIIRIIANIISIISIIIIINNTNTIINTIIITIIIIIIDIIYCFLPLV